MTGLEVLGRELANTHDWRLGAGGRAQWIPARPLAIDLPGFRDAGRFDVRSFEPIFAITVLDERGDAIDLVARERNWNPARLELRYATAGAQWIERRTVTSNDCFVSQLTVVHAADAPRRFWLLCWTRLPAIRGTQFSELEANGRGISLQWAPRAGDANRVGFALGASAFADSWSIDACGDGPVGDWRTMPFAEQMGMRGLPGNLPRRIDDADGLCLAMAYPIEVRPGEREVITFVAAFADDAETARCHHEVVASNVNAIQASEEEWIHWFEEAPDFTCSNPLYQKLYWARWADRRLWRSWRPDDVDADLGPFGSQSAAVVENAWRLGNDEAVGALLDWLEGPFDRALEQPLALAARRLLALHPDIDLLAEIERIADLTRVSGEPPVDIPDVATRTFAIDLMELAIWIVERDGGDASLFRQRAASLLATLDEHFAHTAGAVRSPLAVLPALVDGLRPSELRGLLDALADPDRFWTARPLASLARSDAEFRADAIDCIGLNRSGRVWPALNALVVESLGHRAERLSPICRLFLAELVDRTLQLAVANTGSASTVRIEFHDHYNPHNGRPAANSDRQRPAGGWHIDHILRYVAGVRPREDGRIIVDPLPFGLEWFAVDRLFVGDRELAIEWDQRSGLCVRIDEKPAAQAPAGRALAMHLAEHWPDHQESEPTQRRA